MSRIIVTGAAGFIGSSAVDRLLAAGHTVVGYDNFSTGQRPFLSSALKHPNFKLIDGDCLDLATLTDAMAGGDWCWHFAANADVRHGTEHPRKDLEQNTIATFNVLEAMRTQRVKKLVFSSTGSVYGEAKVIPTPEDAPFPVQTSLYAASKLAGEGMIQAYCEGFGFEAWIFRFVSILGERYTHGHVFDFYKQLMNDPTSLRVLGDGKQRKSYLHIQDCLNAIFHLALEGHGKGARAQVYNLGTDAFCQIEESIGWICKALGVNPKITLTGGDRGWIGDNPFIFLETKKARMTGWTTNFTIEQSVIKTIQWIKENEWVLQNRT